MLSFSLSKPRLSLQVPSLLRTLTNMSHPGHLKRTEDKPRQQTKTMATVKAMENISPLVKKIRLQVHSPNVTFKAGQWVDFQIPGVSTVGGFSMCSSPSLLTREEVLDLAVKYSDHPPAHWVHTKCEVGAIVTLTVGGDFYYDVTEASCANKPLLLIAGGVGINPLLSILREICDQNLSIKANLLYSSKSHEELIFKSEINEMCSSNSNITCQYFVTQESCSSSPSQQTAYQYGRISKAALQSVLSSYENKANVLCYLCGPGPLSDTCQSNLIELGLDKQQILYEKWW